MVTDRRVVRTRTALYDALVRLVGVRDYDQITVEDILREANIGRSTFYAHFSSKDDLLKNSLERLKTLLVSARDQYRRDRAGLGGAGHGFDVSRVLFEHVHEFADIRRALAGGRGGVVVSEAVDTVLTDLLRESFPATVSSDVPRELAIRHVVATFNTILRWSLNSRRQIQPSEADRLFKALVLDGLTYGWRAAFVECFGRTS